MKQVVPDLKFQSFALVFCVGDPAPLLQAPSKKGPDPLPIFFLPALASSKKAWIPGPDLLHCSSFIT